VSIDNRGMKVGVRRVVGGGNVVCAERLTLTGKDDLLFPDEVGLDGAASPEVEAFVGAAVVRVASEEAAGVGVPSGAAVDVIGAPAKEAPDPAAPAAAVTSAETLVVAPASPQ